MDSESKTLHPLAGRKQSPEHIAKRSAALIGKGKGKIPWNKGRPHSEKTREKIRFARAQQVIVIDPESRRRWWIELKADPIRYEIYRAKLREAKIRSPVWNKGIPCCEETKRKLSAKNRGVSNVAIVGIPRPEHVKLAMLKAITGRVCKPETRLKRHLAMKGRDVVPPEHRHRGENHPYWQKQPPKGTGIGKGSYCLKGHWVRSSWEREVADWFYLNTISYEYEAKLFDLGDGLRYRPDFHLIATDSWVEVKGYETVKDREKFSKFIAQGHKLFIFDKHHWRLFQKTGTLRNIIAA